MERLSRLCLFVFLALSLRAQKEDTTEKPQYFDPPAFIVAGVTNSADRGGHGSDAIVRSADVLAQATASLSSASRTTENVQFLRQAVSRDPQNADLQHSLAEAEEQLGNPLEAVRAYERAAELDPTEPHLFDWGAELLVHRAAQQSVEVFTRATGLFPRSSRLLLGLAVALYSNGSYEQSRDRFFDAADVNPADATPYVFMARVESTVITQSPGYAARMERFAQLHPENAWANYGYATTLLAHATTSGDKDARAKAEVLLEKAVTLDPQLSRAWLELGTLYADRNENEKAISAWKMALASGSHAEEAHLRLAQLYRRTGNEEKARTEIELYEQQSKESAQERERRRSEIKQFIFTLRKPSR